MILQRKKKQGLTERPFGSPIHKEMDERDTTTFKHEGQKVKKKGKKSEMSGNCMSVHMSPEVDGSICETSTTFNILTEEETTELVSPMTTFVKVCPESNEMMNARNKPDIIPNSKRIPTFGLN